MAKVILSNGEVYRISTDSDISNHAVNDIHTVVDLSDSDFNSVKLNQKHLTYSNNTFNLSDQGHSFVDEANLKTYLQIVIKNIDLFLMNNSSNAMYNDLKTYKEFCENFNATDYDGNTIMTFPYNKSPLELYLQHNVIYEGKKTTFLKTGQSSTFENSYLNINKKNENDMHPAKQLGKCPYVHKNKNLPFQKIMNPWIIKTPPGYSCLFVPPLNNTDDRFSIIPGIVDTDIYPGEINFPIIVNGDKYPVLETMISIGTPYVQVIPFKRESWKMKIKVNTVKKNERFIYKMREKMLHSYKSTWWNKKKWK